MSKKLSLVNTSASSLKEVWECFIISKTSKCVSDATLSNYHHHLRAIAKHLDIEMPLEELSKDTCIRTVQTRTDVHIRETTGFPYAVFLTVRPRFAEEKCGPKYIRNNMDIYTKLGIVYKVTWF